MTFCGNFVELVEKQSVLEEINDFIQWKEFEGDPKIEFYIEKSIIPELEGEELIYIDAVHGTLPNGEKIGFLFIKNLNRDVYGSRI